AVGIRWQGSCCVGKVLMRAFCHVERSAAQSRHLAANRACLSFAARFLHSGPFGCAQGRLFGLRSKGQAS
ncbi:MAG: hypothetical protein ACYS74_20190, partial [Planctomycetota bacterium]